MPRDFERAPPGAPVDPYDLAIHNMLENAMCAILESVREPGQTPKETINAFFRKVDEHLAHCDNHHS